MAEITGDVPPVAGRARQPGHQTRSSSSSQWQMGHEDAGAGHASGKSVRFLPDSRLKAGGTKLGASTGSLGPSNGSILSDRSSRSLSTIPGNGSVSRAESNPPVMAQQIW